MARGQAAARQVWAGGLETLSPGRSGQRESILSHRGGESGAGGQKGFFPTKRSGSPAELWTRARGTSGVSWGEAGWPQTQCFWGACHSERVASGVGVTQVFWGQEPALNPEQPLRACPSGKGLSYSMSVSLGDVLSQGSANGRAEFQNKNRAGRTLGGVGGACLLSDLPTALASWGHASPAEEVKTVSPANGQPYSC